MNPVGSLIFILVGGGAILLFAFRFKFIGGGGAGAYRDKSPFNYWLGVGMTSVGVLFAAVMLVLISVGIVQP